MKKNYHAHTYRCGHAFQTEREYIEAAISRGFDEFGFSEHAPYVFPKEKNYHSTYRMPSSELEDYVNTVNSLKEEYEGRIKLHLGYELEFYPSCFEETYNYLKKYGFEYLILGQHFTNNEYDGVYSYNRNSDEAVFKSYTDSIIEAMKTGVFIYLAHPDLFNFQGDEGFYREEAQRLCEAAVKYNMPVELNLLGIRDGRAYPKEAFWEVAGKVKGLKTILGTDAHTVNCVLDTEAIKTAFGIAERYGLDVISELEGL